MATSISSLHAVFWHGKTLTEWPAIPFAFSGSVRRRDTPAAISFGQEHREVFVMATDYSDYEFLKVEVADRVATITINRPDSLNAVNNVVHHELEQIWIDVRADRDVNAIILTGAGRAFCAGGDVKGMAAGSLTSSTGKAGKGRGRGPIAASNGRRLVDNMLDVEQPIIGAINGDAVGLGATLALLCDITVVSEKARFAD